jgi:hypothetical protein
MPTPVENPISWFDESRDEEAAKRGISIARSEATLSFRQNESRRFSKAITSKHLANVAF